MRGLLNFLGLLRRRPTEGAAQPSGSDALLLEIGDYLLLEDGSSHLLLEP